MWAKKCPRVALTTGGVAPRYLLDATRKLPDTRVVPAAHAARLHAASRPFLGAVQTPTEGATMSTEVSRYMTVTVTIPFSGELPAAGAWSIPVGAGVLLNDVADFAMDAGLHGGDGSVDVAAVAEAISERRSTDTVTVQVTVA